MIANTDVLSDFIQKHSGDRTLLEKLRDALHELVQKLTGKAKKQAQTAEEMLQQAFEAAAQQAEKNSKNAANDGGEAKFSIKMLDDGRYYVKSDRQVLSGNDPTKWGKQLQDYINAEIRRGNDIVLPTTDGRLVRITERSAYKLADDKTTNLRTHEKTKLSDEEYRVKETAASHIDEIVLVGEFSHSQKDIGGYHENDIGEDGFNSYIAYFENGDGKYYQVTFTSALNGDLETAYSIGDIRERKKPTSGTGSSARESSALNGGRLSGKNVAQSSSGVKPKLSLKTDSEGRQLTEAQEEYFKGSKARDAEGRLLTLYHGTGADFTVFDGGRVEQNFENRGGDLGFYFTPYAEDAKGYARNATGYTGSGKVMEVYLNLENPLIVEDSGWGDAIQQADTRHGDLKRWAKEGGHDGIIVKSTDIEMDNGEADAVYIAFSPEQIKSVTNENPTRNTDIRYSLKEYTAEEKKQHVSDAISFFGKTYRWAETGYLTPNGTKLDFSGRHEGGSGGYRTVDHRDIRDAIGDDYGGDDADA